MAVAPTFDLICPQNAHIVTFAHKWSTGGWRICLILRSKHAEEWIVQHRAGKTSDDWESVWDEELQDGEIQGFWVGHIPSDAFS